MRRLLDHILDLAPIMHLVCVLRQRALTPAKARYSQASIWPVACSGNFEQPVFGVLAPAIAAKAFEFKN